MQGVGEQGLAQSRRNRGGDLAVDDLGRSLQLAVARALKQPECEHNRLGLLDGKHERRQIEPWAENVADPPVALDRNAPCLQYRNIAVDGTRYHFQGLGKLCRRRWL